MSAEPRIEEAEDDRRGFLHTTSTVLMGGGLACGYGTFTYIAARFLYPATPDTSEWQFLSTVEQLKAVPSMPYTSPSGAKVVVANNGDGTEDSFLALSSVCPHLGCVVHWEPHNDRFFCPCHNGVFDRAGEATAGPPAAAGQSLAQFPIKVEDGLVYVKVPTQSVTQVASTSAVPDDEGTIA